VHTQIPLHVPYGGVVPEIASRSHVQKIGAVVAGALEQANLTLEQLDAVAVTNGPGLVGALLVGLSYAKGLAYAAGLPFLGVHHIAAHIAANYLTYPELEPPFTCLIVSGGHSHIVAVEPDETYRLLGCTRDDAAGEAFDKVARALGLAYPEGRTSKNSRLRGTQRVYIPFRVQRRRRVRLQLFRRKDRRGQPPAYGKAGGRAGQPCRSGGVLSAHGGGESCEKSGARICCRA
jgi:N6-L-threonylcarbamoyladenine synthase